MEDRLGCKIEVIEDKDSSYPCKIEYTRNYARQLPLPHPLPALRQRRRIYCRMSIDLRSAFGKTWNIHMS